MTQERLNYEIEAYLLINEVSIDEEYVPHVAQLTYESNYVQILYDYGIEVLLTVLEVLEKNEMYEKCANIKKTIEFSNELEGSEYPTNYR